MLNHNRSRKKLPLVLFIAGSTLIIFAAAVFARWEFHDPEKVFADFAQLRDEETDEERKPAAYSGNQEDSYDLPLIINIVFLGLDRTDQVERFNRQEISDRVQPDTIIFAALDIKEHKIDVLSISRDSKVPISDRGFNDKINHAFYYGTEYGDGVDEQTRVGEGIRFTLETIENLVGAPVDFYVTLDIDDLIKIVDLMGGVYYDVEQDIRADLGQGRVLIEKGYQHLDGEHFFYYIQYRDVYGRHHDRMNRQQRILKSTFKQYREAGKLAQIPTVINFLRKSIMTNLESKHIGALLRFAGELNPEAIKFHSFEGEGIFTEYGYYFYIDEEQRAKLLKEVLGVDVESMGIIKGVPFEFEEGEEEFAPFLFESDFWQDEYKLVDLN